jgi:MSHA biogenesis protein MshQ
VLSAIKRSSDNFTNPAAANSSGTAFVKAGEAFSVAVAATTCTPVSATCTVAGITTPNYGQETTPESVKLTPSNVIAGMATPPSISGSFGLFTAGVATGTAFSWSEVGIITLTPSISDANYFNNGDVTGTISGNVGRFYPDHFDTIITGPLPCLLTLVCPTGGSAYSGQPFTANVYAKNATDGTVTNYNSVTGFSRQVTLSAWDTLGSTATQNPPAATSSALSGVIAASAFTSGSTALGSPGTPAYTFGVTPTIPTDIYIRANDADGVTSLRTSSTSVEGGIKVVSGRIKISNAVGSELLPLTVSATLQYYNTNIWTTNLADSVSTMTLAGSYNAIKNGVIIGTTTPVPTGVVTFTGGKKSIVLGKPTGAGTVTLNPSVPSYLPLTPGTVTFGVYQGRKEFIYLRENY